MSSSVTREIYFRWCRFIALYVYIYHYYISAVYYHYYYCFVSRCEVVFTFARGFGVSLIVIFARAAREPVHTDGYGPLP
jgi:hypothetical protein